jgi:hypothetical protein
MKVAPHVIDVVAAIAVLIALSAWFYSVRYFLPMWAVNFRRRENHRGYMMKVLIGAGIFVASIGGTLIFATYGRAAGLR